MLSSERVATRSALIQLKEEQAVVQEAYDFLDEKRLLLAAELLRQLRHYEDLMAQYALLHEQAHQALQAAVQRHGLHGVQVYPARFLEDARITRQRSRFMGVNLIRSDLQLPEMTAPDIVSYRSPEAETCRELFLQLARHNTVLAALSGNLHRLLAEYQRTQRRARALENVIMPEIANDLRIISHQLEEHDQEDVLRAHMRR